MTGMVGSKWSIPDFAPMDWIPSAVCLTTYSGGSEDFIATPLDELCKIIEDGTMKVFVGKVFKLDQIVQAHETMDANTAGGKIVLVMD
jgi:NADPH:quinone reductase-like Zn-dependent oxidoreductase